MRAAIFAIVMSLSPPCAAGEFECFLKCDFSGIGPVKWKPSGCYKPSAPLIFATNRQDYNLAVDMFNNWLRSMELYTDCVRQEAIGDLKKMPDIFKEGMSKAHSEANDEISTARSRLQMMRP